MSEQTSIIIANRVIISLALCMYALFSCSFFKNYWIFFKFFFRDILCALFSFHFHHRKNITTHKKLWNEVKFSLYFLFKCQLVCFPFVLCLCYFYLCAFVKKLDFVNKHKNERIFTSLERTSKRETRNEQREKTTNKRVDK